MRLYFNLGIMVLYLFCSCSGGPEKAAPQPASPGQAAMAADTTDPVETIKATDTVPSKGPVMLRFNMLKGKTYSYAFDLDVSEERPDNKLNSHTQWSFDMQAMEEKGEIKTIKTTYRQIAMSMDMGGGRKMNFSSEDPVDELNLMQLPSRLFAAVKGKSFFMKVNGEGRVVEVSGFDQLGEDVIKEMAIPEQMRPMIRQTFSTQFNEKAIDGLFAPFFSVFPGKAVKAGDLWQRKGTLTLGPVQGTAASSYRIKQINERRAVIEEHTTISQEQSPGVRTSQMTVDPSTGLIVRGSFELKTSGERKTLSKGRIRGKIS